MGNSIGNNISKYLSCQYSQKRLDYVKQSATDALKNTSKRVFQKTAGAAGDPTGNKISDRITKDLKTSQQNN